MILKWLITAAVAYVIYKFFIAPQRKVNAAEQQAPLKEEGSGEYIDYEEVE